MIYISAQPDQVYFLWQLQLQLFNFRSTGISDEHIHILVGYNPAKGIHPAFKSFAEQHKEINICFYPDTRIHPKYLSSIRPHLLAKHFRQYPHLTKKVLFYHDSDILFTQVPEWDILAKDDVWYASDTRSYLDSNYIKKCIGEEEFFKMCAVLSIEPSVVEAHNDSAGGAQYLLKSCTAAFWEKIESDCERLFTYLRHRQKYGKHIPQDFQIWCTDMWVIWWNTLLLKQNFRIHPLLDFSWADSPVSELRQKTILHYTGKVKGNARLFDKTLYQTHAPFYDDLSSINPEICSIKVAETIKAYQEISDRERPEIPDTLLILIRQENETDERRTEIATRYYSRYWKIEITSCFQNEVAKIIASSSHQHIITVSCHWIIPSGEMNQIIKSWKTKPYRWITYPIKIYQMDPLGIHIFSKLLDDTYLEENKGKTIPRSASSAINIYNNNNGKESVKDRTIEVYGL